MMGCCTDKACNDQTCMKLPNGMTCADCVHGKRCIAMFGMKEVDTACSFFPRRFSARRGLKCNYISNSGRSCILKKGHAGLHLYIVENEEYDKCVYFYTDDGNGKIDKLNKKEITVMLNKSEIILE